ncbi:lipopolysaccharide assembly protein LapB [Cyanothece sp. BG0011]|uniref:tetratricopeptide repeat protein n=1 Tax=Cyanothece sp. BG0011 TaxID=2082950 RepID=UPI000D1DF3CB|nr:tetratricopeptide repeat protein [Cyanothece sp. BG0011]
MKNAKTKKRRWIYATLVLMLLALISFSILPVVSSMVQAQQADQSSLVTTESTRLKNEALGYQMVLEREPDNENALLGLLETRLRQGDLEAAITPLKRLAQLNPQEPDYGILLAQSQQQLKNYEAALNTYQEIIVANPGDMRALKGMVDLYIQQNRSQTAISLVQNTLNEAIKEQSNESISESVFNLTSLQLLLGEIYSQQERYDDALVMYDQAIKGDKNDFRPLLAKGMLLREQGQENEAQTLFKEAILKAPVQYKEQLKDISLQRPQDKKKEEMVEPQKADETE